MHPQGLSLLYAVRDHSAELLAINYIWLVILNYFHLPAAPRSHWSRLVRTNKLEFCLPCGRYPNKLEFCLPCGRYPKKLSDDGHCWNSSLRECRKFGLTWRIHVWCRWRPPYACSLFASLVSHRLLDCRFKLCKLFPVYILSSPDFMDPNPFLFFSIYLALYFFWRVCCFASLWIVHSSFLDFFCDFYSVLNVVLFCVEYMRNIFSFSRMSICFWQKWCFNKNLYIGHSTSQQQWKILLVRKHWPILFTPTVWIFLGIERETHAWRAWEKKNQVLSAGPTSLQTCAVRRGQNNQSRIGGAQRGRGPPAYRRARCDAVKKPGDG